MEFISTKMNIDPHAVWTNVHNIHGDGMGTIYREDETQCTQQLCNGAIPVFIASAQQTLLIANEQLALRIETRLFNNVNVGLCS